MILLICEYASGSIALDATRIDGLEVANRYYEITDHFVEVDGGGNDTVAQHDAEILTAMVGYRLATPKEQKSYAQAKAQVGQVVEDVPGNSRDSTVTGG